MCLFRQLNTAASLCCVVADSLIQHVAPRYFKLLHSWSEEESPIILLSCDEKSNQRMRENWISKGK